MIRRLEQQSVMADLAQVEAILARRPREDDPVGWLQFDQRRQRLVDELSKLGDAASDKSVALLFGGRPVVGSRGIAADFTAAMIGLMQSLVSIQSASRDGVLGERGPIPQRGSSQMLVTDVARGSFGFIMEGPIDYLSNEETDAVDEVCELLTRVASNESENFNAAVESVDNRILGPLKSFFRTLDEDGATLRLVSDKQDFEFTKQAVERARQRVDFLELSEPYLETIIGRIFTMPDSKRFELFPIGGNPVVKGNLTSDFVRQMFSNDYVAEGDFNGKVFPVIVRVRETRLRNAPSRKSYQLVTIESDDHGSAANNPPTSSTPDDPAR